MSLFYKVVRPDLASFADPTFKYRIGHARLAPKVANRTLCEHGLLHASPTAPQAAGFGYWPYRLLLVEGEPVVSQADKSGFVRLMVKEELSVSQCFGPNGEQVLRILRRAERLTINEADRLAAARAAVGAAAWDAARAAAWAAAWPAARDAVGVAMWNAVGAAAWDAVGNAARAAAWAAVGNAAWDAARAPAWVQVVADLVGQHGLTQKHIDTLVGPWNQVIGEDW